MKPVIQEEITGCGIASSAAIAGISYKEAKKLANSMGIYAEDQSLWSDTEYIRRLLAKLGFRTRKGEIPFKSWETLPNCALLSIKWHIENGKPFWHWVIFVRESGKQYVLDSKKALKNNIRTDFGRMKPKWYIEVRA
jgi:ABC-type bacteriocin/lantibiotic exporter with double-glycine peptidase domain